jgi:hypothetical protein
MTKTYQWKKKNLETYLAALLPFIRLVAKSTQKNYVSTWKLSTRNGSAKVTEEMRQLRYFQRKEMVWIWIGVNYD